VAELMCRWQSDIRAGVVMLMATGDLTPLEAALDLSIGYLRSRRPA
jgi:hypothetical protein